MPEPIIWQVIINPYVSQTTSIVKDGGSDDEVRLSTAQVTALRAIVAGAKSGSISTNSLASIQKILDMENEGNTDWNTTNQAATLTFLTEIEAGTDVSTVVTAINAL